METWLPTAGSYDSSHNCWKLRLLEVNHTKRGGDYTE